MTRVCEGVHWRSIIPLVGGVTRTREGVNWCLIISNSTSLSLCLLFRCRTVDLYAFYFVYYESIKRELKRRLTPYADALLKKRKRPLGSTNVFRAELPGTHL